MAPLTKCGLWDISYRFFLECLRASVIAVHNLFLASSDKDEFSIIRIIEGYLRCCVFLVNCNIYSRLLLNCSQISDGFYCTINVCFFDADNVYHRLQNRVQLSCTSGIWC